VSVVLCAGGPGVHHSVGKLLEPFAKKIDRTGLLQTLYLVHRLDKETTGVMVLAKSVSYAEEYLYFFIYIPFIIIKTLKVKGRVNSVCETSVAFVVVSSDQ